MSYRSFCLKGFFFLIWFFFEKQTNYAHFQMHKLYFCLLNLVVSLIALFQDVLDVDRFNSLQL